MDEKKSVRCAGCGKPLLCRDDLYYGDIAWHIGEEWWCDDCARDEFRQEVTE